MKNNWLALYAAILSDKSVNQSLAALGIKLLRKEKLPRSSAKQQW